MKKSLLFVAVMLLGMQTMFAQDYALKLSGADDQRVIMASDSKLDELNGATDFTIEFWAFIPKDVKKNDVLIKRKNSFAFTMYTNSVANGDGVKEIKRVYMTHYASTKDKYRNTTDNVVNLGQWNHFAIISNSTSDVLTIYVNGVGVNDVDSGVDPLKTPATPGTDDEFVIGYDGFNDGYSSKFAIDKLRITTSALAIGDLNSSDVNVALTSDANDILVMNFNEGSGTTVSNEINSATGLVEGGAEWVQLSDPFLALDKNNTIEFGIFPNPAVNGFVTIQAQNNEKISSVEIFNTLGKSVLTIDAEDDAQISLNVNGLNEGLYFVRTSTNNGIATQKLVIK